MRSRAVDLVLPLLFVWLPTAARASPAASEESSSSRSLSLLALSVQEVAPSDRSGDTEDCRLCHEEDLYLFNRTEHALQTDSCYACHVGARAEDHNNGQLDGEDIPGPAITTLSTEEANAVCLDCHESSHHPMWEGSAHQRRGLKCIDCHSVHSFEAERKLFKTAVVAETCYQCHQPIRSMMLRTSHHPVREGLLGCESCHNPHDGSRPKMIKADWTNELCYQCHTEKRGPFLWEHAPAREDCLNCHNPHGTNHDKMLRAKPPYLCQRCHLNTRHPGTLYDGFNAGTSIAAASNRAIEHACKNCHQNIHGTNTPSAPYLGR